MLASDFIIHMYRRTCTCSSSIFSLCIAVYSSESDLKLVQCGIYVELLCMKGALHWVWSTHVAFAFQLYSSSESACTTVSCCNDKWSWWFTVHTAMTMSGVGGSVILNMEQFKFQQQSNCLQFYTQWVFSTFVNATLFLKEDGRNCILALSRYNLNPRASQISALSFLLCHAW